MKHATSATESGASSRHQQHGEEEGGEGGTPDAPPPQQGRDDDRTVTQHQRKKRKRGRPQPKDQVTEDPAVPSDAAIDEAKPREADCSICRIKNNRCDGGRPCGFCIDLGVSDMCTDVPPKRRRRTSSTVLVPEGGLAETEAPYDSEAPINFESFHSGIFSGQKANFYLHIAKTENPRPHGAGPPPPATILPPPVQQPPPSTSAPSYPPPPHGQYRDLRPAPPPTTSTTKTFDEGASATTTHPPNAPHQPRFSPPQHEATPPSSSFRRSGPPGPRFPPSPPTTFRGQSRGFVPPPEELQEVEEEEEEGDSFHLPIYRDRPPRRAPQYYSPPVSSMRRPLPLAPPTYPDAAHTRYVDDMQHHHPHPHPHPPPRVQQPVHPRTLPGSDFLDAAAAGGFPSQRLREAPPQHLEDDTFPMLPDQEYFARQQQQQHQQRGYGGQGPGLPMMMGGYPPSSTLTPPQPQLPPRSRSFPPGPYEPPMPPARRGGGGPQQHWRGQ